MIIDDMGSLSGTVLEDGYPVPNMLITVENTVFNTTTNQNVNITSALFPLEPRPSPPARMVIRM